MSPAWGIMAAPSGERSAVLHVTYEDGDGRVVVLDSLTHVDARVTPRDVVVAGSFAGAPAFGWALERGVRGLGPPQGGARPARAGLSGPPLPPPPRAPAAAPPPPARRPRAPEKRHTPGRGADLNHTARGL